MRCATGVTIVIQGRNDGGATRGERDGWGWGWGVSSAKKCKSLPTRPLRYIYILLESYIGSLLLVIKVIFSNLLLASVFSSKQSFIKDFFSGSSGL